MIRVSLKWMEVEEGELIGFCLSQIRKKGRRLKRSESGEREKERDDQKVN